MKITTAQSKFLQSENKITAFIGGIGSGKTLILCVDAILACLKGKRSAIISFSYPMLRDVIIPMMTSQLELMKVPYEFNKSDMVFIIAGTELLIRSADKPDSLRGLNLYNAYIDEACYTKEEIFYIILGRLRLAEDGQLKLGTTPKGKKNWVFKNVVSDTDALILTQSTMGNPFLPKSYKDELLKQYSGKFAQQELYGSWVEFGAGIINPNWLREIAILNPVPVGVRFWDLAVSIKKNADYSAGAHCSIAGNRLIIHDIAHLKVEYPDLKKQIIINAQRDGQQTVIAVEDAGQQRGFIDDLKRTPELMPYTIKAIRPNGDKLNRALPWISRAELGAVEVCQGNWNKAFFDECDSFSGDD